jgi:hypothetical protein
MKTRDNGSASPPIPRPRQKHHSYDESVDEPAGLIEDEPVEIEGETPAEENEPVEQINPESGSEMPQFEQ